MSAFTKRFYEAAASDYFEETEVSSWSYQGFLEAMKPFCIAGGRGSVEDRDFLWRKKFNTCLKTFVNDDKQSSQNDLCMEQQRVAKFLLNQKKSDTTFFWRNLDLEIELAEKQAIVKRKSQIDGLDLLDTARNQQNGVLASDLSATTPKKLRLMEQLSDTELSPRQILKRDQNELATDDGEVQMSHVDITRFKEAYEQMDDTKKWVLSSGKVVEDQLYKFGLKCTHEHLCHSFIIDPDDASLMNEKVFTKSEIEEIRTYRRQALPNMPQDLLAYLVNYKKSNISDLKDLLFCSESWKSAYNRERDFDRDWIRNTVDNLLRLYEAKSLDKDHSEAWLNLHVWSLVDRAFQNVDGIEVERIGIVLSLRRGDLIIRTMSKEFGCGEAGRLFSGNNGTKILRERGLKTPKVMKDQFDDLCAGQTNENTVRKLRTVGFIHAGLSVLLLTLDSPTGYICRISRSNLLRIPSTVSEFGKRVLPVIMLVWKAKKIVCDTIEIMGNDDNNEDGLEALQRSCDNDPRLTPPHQIVCLLSCFDTPEKKDAEKKDKRCK
ncbi:728_t:CDS:10 [Paraglomus brasilianum]|uniref:728_t:CDS:1 n=1 Tax=Paraglomus brasilianum TaxID=144538 RepID=A0A9N9CX95_9GLOM|nr:728_t:CDS:10 [Paraglomus brasilianum]